MGCYDPERDDDFLHLTRFAEGRIPSCSIRDFSIPSLKEEIEKKLLKFKNALSGEEERKLDLIVSINQRVDFSSEKALSYRFLLENYLFPFLKRLVVYRVNEPEGLKELLLLIDVIEKELSISPINTKNTEERIERAFDVLITHLYQHL
jgi:hypothetical protein